MSLRGNLELKVSTSLRGLSETDMQRVAEDYVRIYYPERFSRFDYRAISAEGRSRGGWPDAWANDFGKISGVEATIEKKKSAIRKHVNDYIEKITTSRHEFSVFVHISGCPDIDFGDDDAQLNHWKKVCETQIGSVKVELIFGTGLIEILCRPEFARTRFEILNIDYSPRYFRLFHAKRGPDEGRLNNEFVPSDTDYASGRVHRPALADIVLDRLYDKSIAFVRGVGASGKSVLAWLIALDFTKGGLPSYMLDLSDYILSTPEISSSITADLKTFCHPQSLFIVDNCHLNEPLAKDIFLAWQDHPPTQRPRLLLLGRELRSSRGSLLSGLTIEPLVLRARQPEVLGVYLRLVARYSGTADRPPDFVLDQWVKEFGGDPNSPNTTTDLIAFSAAVLRKQIALREGKWPLRVEDAIDEIRAVYLGGEVTQEEYSNIIRLCAVAEAELFLPEASLANSRAGFDISNRKYGIVFSVNTGKAKIYRNYIIAHSALAKLILSAAHEKVDRSKERITAALLSPILFSAMLVRLRSGESKSESLALVRAIEYQPEFILTFPSLSYIETTLRYISNLDSSVFSKVAQQLAAYTAPRNVIQIALDTPLHFLANFIKYSSANDELRPIYDVLVKDLTIEENIHVLFTKSNDTPLHLFVSFLEYIKRHPNLSIIYNGFIIKLIDAAKLRKIDFIREQIKEAALGALAYLLKHLGQNTSLRTLVLPVILRDIIFAEDMLMLKERALNSSLGELKSFLQFMIAAAMPNSTGKESIYFQTILKGLANYLSQSRSIYTITGNALLAPLDQLVAFFEVLESSSELRSLFDSLVNALRCEDNILLLSKSMEVAPLDAVVSALDSPAVSSLWSAVFKSIEIDSWVQNRLKEERPKIDAFVSFQRIASKLERADLASAPALRIVRLKNKKDWHQAVIGFHHLATVLRYAHSNLTGLEIDAFLSCILRSQWAEKLISERPPSILAINLFSIAILIGPNEHKLFDHDVVRNRVAAEFDKFSSTGIEQRSSAVSLLGAAAAIGVKLSSRHVVWPTGNELTAIIEMSFAQEEQSHINNTQAQLWLGLRELTVLIPEAPSVPVRLAEQTLMLWQAAHKAPEMLQSEVLRTLNSEMVSWLIACRVAGWRLVP